MFALGLFQASPRFQNFDSDSTPNTVVKTPDPEPVDNTRSSVGTAITDCKLSSSPGFVNKITQLNQVSSCF